MKRLVTYFSASGRTRKVAENLSNALDCDIYEIKPAIPYTKDDLNWMNKKSRSSLQMKDKSCRPELADKDAKIEDYDIIYIGFPIWWYVAPTIINTFLESYDFSNKKIILFATSGGSGFGKTTEELKISVNDSTIIKEGRLFNSREKIEELKQWSENKES